MRLYFSPHVRQKLLDKHNVTEAQVLECFANRDRAMLIDDREEHRTTPPTQWFIAQTDFGVRLKVCFVMDRAAGILEIKTAFPCSQAAIQMYEAHAPLL